MHMNGIHNQLDDAYNQLIRKKNQTINPHLIEEKASLKRHMIHTNERNTRLIFQNQPAKDQQQHNTKQSRKLTSKTSALPATQDQPAQRF